MVGIGYWNLAEFGGLGHRWRRSGGDKAQGESDGREGWHDDLHDARHGSAAVYAPALPCRLDAPSLSQASSPVLPLKKGTQTHASNDYNDIPSPMQLGRQRLATGAKKRKTAAFRAAVFSYGKQQRYALRHRSRATERAGFALPRNA